MPDHAEPSTGGTDEPTAQREQLPVAGELPVTPARPVGVAGAAGATPSPDHRDASGPGEGSPSPQADPAARAARVARLAQDSGRSVAVAESLTAGALSSALGAAPSSSDWFRGGVVAYASEVKHSLLQVPQGPVVSEDAATAMARATADLLGADLALAVTGAGGPEPQDGQPAGTVWLAVCVGTHTVTECRRFPGDPESVVQQTVLRALALLQQILEAAPRP